MPNLLAGGGVGQGGGAKPGGHTERGCSSDTRLAASCELRYSL